MIYLIYPAGSRFGRTTEIRNPFDLSEHFENMFTSMKQRLKNPDIVLTEINLSLLSGNSGP